MPLPEGGRIVVRTPDELRVHPTFEEIGLGASLSELHESASGAVEEPLYTTSSGLILSGFERWRLAVLRHTTNIECVEYGLTEDDALQFMLDLQKRRKHWNAFVRIRLALKLESIFQQRALTNMQKGGKCKGLAMLPKADHIDVRQQIAMLAGVGSRNVGKVKEILDKAHPRLKDELLIGTISINRAHQLCKLPRATQLERFTEECCDKVISQVRERVLATQWDKQTYSVATILNSLQQQELERPGSVVIQVSQRRGSVILLGEDMRAALLQQRARSL